MEERKTIPHAENMYCLCSWNGNNFQKESQQLDQLRSIPTGLLLKDLTPDMNIHVVHQKCLFTLFWMILLTCHKNEKIPVGSNCTK